MIDSPRWCSHFLWFKKFVFAFSLLKKVSTVNKHPFKEEQMLALGFPKTPGILDM